jgi:hypothetical protein
MGITISSKILAIHTQDKAVLIPAKPRQLNTSLQDMVVLHRRARNNRRNTSRVRTTINIHTVGQIKVDSSHMVNKDSRMGKTQVKPTHLILQTRAHHHILKTQSRPIIIHSNLATLLHLATIRTTKTNITKVLHMDLRHLNMALIRPLTANRVMLQTFLLHLRSHMDRASRATDNTAKDSHMAHRHLNTGRDLLMS